ncbi:MAG: hypothetical protein LBT76_02385 [Tannerella sp.]|nr:hypothetical protein [Tannerella sp.]
MEHLNHISPGVVAAVAGTIVLMGIVTGLLRASQGRRCLSQDCPSLRTAEGQNSWLRQPDAF